MGGAVSTGEDNDDLADNLVVLAFDSGQQRDTMGGAVSTGEDNDDLADNLVVLAFDSGRQRDTMGGAVSTGEDNDDLADNLVVLAFDSGRQRDTMGGAVSTGEDNDDLVDNLVEHSCITSCCVERVFRAVDRAHYFTQESKDSAYKDTAWRSDNLHLSAPCIYSSVVENLALKAGHSFLNIGSGTGYVSTMVGLIIGSNGINHGVELFQDVIDYARERLAQFTVHSAAVDQFDFCPPEFVCGNGLLLGVGRQYDRVYCGARCPSSELPYLKQLLKVGGVLVVPVNDHLKRIERLGPDHWDVQNKLSVSFAPLIEPRVSGHKTECSLPAVVPGSLQQLCRTRVRRTLRAAVLSARPDLAARCRRRPPRRRRPHQRSAEHARRIQRFVIPLFGAAVDADDAEPAQLRHFGQVLYGAVARMARDEWERGRAALPLVEAAGSDESGGESEQPATSEDDAVEPVQSVESMESPPDESVLSGNVDNGGEQPDVPTAGGGYGNGGGDGDATAGRDRAGVKRYSDGCALGDQTAAGPSDAHKRGRRDKFDSGLGDSDDAATPLRAERADAHAAPAESGSEHEVGVESAPCSGVDEPENGVLSSRNHLEPAPRSDRTGRPPRRRPVSQLRYLDTDDEDDREPEPEPERESPQSDGDGSPPRRRPAGHLCCLDTDDEDDQQSERESPPSGRRGLLDDGAYGPESAGQVLSALLRARVAQLPLPHRLQVYVNLGRPL